MGLLILHRASELLNGKSDCELMSIRGSHGWADFKLILPRLWQITVGGFCGQVGLTCCYLLKVILAEDWGDERIAVSV